MNHSIRPTFRPGSSLALALAMTPVRHRPALSVWLSFWQDTARIPFEVHDPAIAEAKLQWWRQEVAAAERGQAQHPCTQAWRATALPAAAIWPAASLWDSQLAGLAALVHQTRWMQDSAWQAHAEATTGAACHGAALLLGATSEAAQAAAARLGLGLRQAHRVARLGQDTRAGWVQVGIDLLQHHDVKAHQLTRPDQSAPAEGLPGLVMALIDQARATLTEAEQQLKRLDRAEQVALRPLRLLARLNLALLDSLAQSPESVLQHRKMLTPLRKAWLAFGMRWGL